MKSSDRRIPERDKFFADLATLFNRGYTFLPRDIGEIAVHYGYSQNSAPHSLIETPYARRAFNEHGVNLDVQFYMGQIIYFDTNSETDQTDIADTQQRIEVPVSAHGDIISQLPETPFNKDLLTPIAADEDRGIEGGWYVSWQKFRDFGYAEFGERDQAQLRQAASWVFRELANNATAPQRYPERFSTDLKFIILPNEINHRPYPKDLGIEKGEEILFEPQSVVDAFYDDLIPLPHSGAGLRLGHAIFGRYVRALTASSSPSTKGRQRII
jgi:hypothetical protein